MILCIGTTPALQRVVCLKRLYVDEVNRASWVLDGAAGKAVNVAKVLHALGEKPFVVGFAGGSRGELLIEIIRRLGLDHTFITTENPTRECVTLIDEEQRTHTELVEESHAVSAAERDAFLRAIAPRFESARAVVLSGTVCPGMPEDFYPECLRRASSCALTVVDAQGRALESCLSLGPGLVKPNLTELQKTLGRNLATEKEVSTAMRELVERGARRVVVTAGAGTTLAYDGVNAWRVHTAKVAVRNPIGSGDAFTGGVVNRLVQGADLGEACRWGAACGAANAMTWMAGEVDAKAVRELAATIQVDPAFLD